MPEIEFEDKEGQKHRQRMFSPKKIQSLDAWLKEARRVIPKIPNPANSDWRIVNTNIEVRWITLEMVNSVGERARIIIDRTKPALGG